MMRCTDQRCDPPQRTAKRQKLDNNNRSAKVRRRRNVDAGRCADETSRVVHGPLHKGGRCKSCWVKTKGHE